MACLDEILENLNSSFKFFRRKESVPLEMRGHPDPILDNLRGIVPKKGVGL